MGFWEHIGEAFDELIGSGAKSDPYRMTVSLPGGAREVFTPLPLQARRMYQLTARGCFTYETGGFFRDRWEADAAYTQDGHGNFTQEYDGLCIDGVSIWQQGNFRENRAAHVYSAWIEGTGHLSSLILRPPKGYAVSGDVDVMIELLPATTPLLSEARAAMQAMLQASLVKRQSEQTALALRAEQERQLVEAEWQRQEQERLAAEEQWQRQENRRLWQEELNRRVDELARMVHQNRNFLDPEFRKAFVSQFGTQILSTYRQQWQQEYDALQSDYDLVAELQTAAPEVLDWYEYRIEMALEAERAATLPPPAAPEPPRRITARTVTHVQRLIDELFEVTDRYDRARLDLAQDRKFADHRPDLERYRAAIAFYYDELKRFGIVAYAPEDAEQQFLELCPPPSATVYEDIVHRLRSGQSVPPDALCDRLEDLHREKVILQARRRAASRANDALGRDAIDGRLSDIRREATDLKAFLESINVPLDARGPQERETEFSREEQLMRLYASQKRVLDFLTQQGDTQSAEHVEALYAQERAKLFEADTPSYT